MTCEQIQDSQANAGLASKCRTRKQMQDLRANAGLASKCRCDPTAKFSGSVILQRGFPAVRNHAAVYFSALPSGPKTKIFNIV